MLNDLNISNFMCTHQYRLLSKPIKISQYRVFNTTPNLVDYVARTWRYGYEPYPPLELEHLPAPALLTRCSCCYSTDPATAARQGGRVAASLADLFEL